MTFSRRAVGLGPAAQLGSYVLVQLLGVAGLVAVLGMSGCQRDVAGDLEEKGASSEPPVEGQPSARLRGRTVYVPAYSQLRRDNPPRATLLTSSLSVRNVDLAASITLTHVDYFNGSGHRVRRYLQTPRALRPLETAEFIVDPAGKAVESGATFVVHWEGPWDAHPLLAETINWGNVGVGLISFTARGVELDRRPEFSDLEAIE